MKLRLYPVTAAILYLLLCACMTRADKAAVQKEIEARYAAFGRAFKSKDLKALMALGTTDLIVKSSQGETLTRQEFEKRYAAALQSIERVNGFSVKIEKLTVSGSRAVVTAQVRLTVESLDEQGNRHRLEEEDQSRDTWVKTSHGWLLKQSEELKAKARRDGKPFDLNAPSSGEQQ